MCPSTDDKAAYRQALLLSVQTFDLVFSEKPVRMSILSATLNRAFASSAARVAT